MKSGHKFEASLGYIVSFRWLEENFVSKKKKSNQTNKNHELGRVAHTFNVSMWKAEKAEASGSWGACKASLVYTVSCRTAWSTQ